MTNPSTVGEDFLVDGTSLMTYAYAISTLAGREKLPPKVGENIRIPYRNGRIWKPKTYDQQVITLGMWIRDRDVNNVRTAGETRGQFNSNLRALKRLFAPTGRQLALTRVLVFATGTETHTALGEASSQMDLSPVTIRYGTFTVDITMADPWWYGPGTSNPVTSSGATINNPGDVEATNMVVTLNGPLTNPRLSNSSLSPAVTLSYTGTILSGQFVTLDCNGFTAFDSSGNSVIGNVSHGGSLRWMLIEPGNNTMSLDNGSGGSPGTGNATIVYSPPYT
jgi:Phage tail protein